VENKYRLYKVSQDELDIGDLANACFDFLYSMESDAEGPEPSDQELYALELKPEILKISRDEQELYEFARSRGISLGEKYEKMVIFDKIFRRLKKIAPNVPFFGICTEDAIVIGFDDSLKQNRGPSNFNNHLKI
jgi:hypothetical protein